MRWIKLAAILSLWLFFFGVVALAHLWISVLRVPNRWRIISRLIRNLIVLLRAILDIKVTVEGDQGKLERGGYVIISNHLGYIDGFVLGSLFPVVFVSKKRSEKLAYDRSVENTFQHHLYQSSKKKPGRAIGQ